jgi:hypothetical protein
VHDERAEGIEHGTMSLDHGFIPADHGHKGALRGGTRTAGDAAIEHVDVAAQGRTRYFVDRGD